MNHCGQSSERIELEAAEVDPKGERRLAPKSGIPEDSRAAEDQRCPRAENLRVIGISEAQNGVPVVKQAKRDSGRTG